MYFVNLILGYLFLRRTSAVLLIALCIQLSKAQSSFLHFYPGQMSAQPGTFIGSVPTCLQLTKDNGFIIGGYTGHPDSLNLQLMQLRKIDAYGNEIWNRKDRISIFDEIDDVVVYDDSTIFCAVRFGSQAGLVKRDGDGQIIWGKLLLPQPDTCSGINSLIEAIDGNLVMCGGYYACNSANADIFVAKTDPAGNFIWKNIVHFPYSSSGMSLIETLDSGYLVTGYTGYDDTTLHLGITQTFLAKYDQFGQQIFFKTYGSDQLGFFGQSIALLPNNNIAIANGCVYPPNYQTDAALIIADDTGTLKSYLIDTLLNENFYSVVRSWNHYAYLLQNSSDFSSPDSSMDLKLQRYNTTSGEMDICRTYKLIGWQKSPLDMRILPDGRIGISFYEVDSIHIGSTGLVVLDSMGCVPDWCATVIREVENENKITVFPNPFTQFFTIVGAVDAEIDLFDCMGHLVVSKMKVNNENIFINQDIPVGLYLLRIRQANQLHIVKLIHD